MFQRRRARERRFWRGYHGKNLYVCSKQSNSDFYRACAFICVALGRGLDFAEPRLWWVRVGGEATNPDPPYDLFEYKLVLGEPAVETL